MWGTLKTSSAEGGQGTTTIKVPWGPNEFLCVVFSCINDPRQAASTDLLLTQKMLEEGLKMGEAKDPRITPAGILTNIDDLDAKLAAYIDLVKTRAALP